MKRPKAQNIQQGITLRLNQLEKQGVLSQKDFDYLYKRTHELYRLARGAGKLEEIQELLDNAMLYIKNKSPNKSPVL